MATSPEERSSASSAVSVDPQRVEELARSGARNREIAGTLGLTCRELVRRYRNELRRGRSSMQVDLRRGQMDAALQGKKPDARMLQWLGKQYLGQTDKPAAGKPRRVGKIYIGVDLDRV